MVKNHRLQKHPYNAEGMQAHLPKSKGFKGIDYGFPEYGIALIIKGVGHEKEAPFKHKGIEKEVKEDQRVIGIEKPDEQ